MPIQSPDVLVVEADLTLRSVLRLVVEQYGLNALTPANAMQALSMATHDCPDLVLVGQDLPSADCCAIVRAAQAATGGSARVVMLGDTAESGACRRARELGADATIRMPFDIEDLGGALRRLVTAEAAVR